MRALPVELHRTDHEASHWLRSRVATILNSWDRHGIRCCTHVATRPPQDLIVWTALWAPTRLVCSQCVRHLGDHNCCNRCFDDPPVLTGLAATQHLRGRAVQVAVALCDACLAKELPA